MLKRTLRIVMPLILLAGSLWLIQGEEAITVQLLFQKVKSAGYWAELYFILLYTVAVLLFMPTYLFTLAGGALFGPWGIAINLFAITMGASLAFLVSRYLNSDWLYHLHNKRLVQVISGVDKQGWRFVAIVRLLPMMPFDLLNYALGLTRISLFQYILTTTVCLVPAITAYSLIGHLGGIVIQGKEDLWEMGLEVVLLITLVGYLPRVLGLLAVGFNIRNHHLQLRK